MSTWEKAVEESSHCGGSQIWSRGGAGCSPRSPRWRCWLSDGDSVGESARSSRWLLGVPASLEGWKVLAESPSFCSAGRVGFPALDDRDGRAERSRPSLCERLSGFLCTYAVPGGLRTTDRVVCPVCCQRTLTMPVLNLMGDSAPDPSLAPSTSLLATSLSPTSLTSIPYSSFYSSSLPPTLSSSNCSLAPSPSSPPYNFYAVLLVLLIFCVVFGNVLVCMAVSREKSLQTTTNYLIVSLAVSDLLLATLVMPWGVYLEVRTPEAQSSPISFHTL
ncbi:hypothetical protein NFI96_000976 [Prochilodus magdalenae]|nr:hypothetical protein NFI96_000976 [Prochilodus magdalenae]